MAKMGAGVAIGLLVAAISFFEPSAAFALRLGPFHVGLPVFGHTLAHRHRARPHSDDHAGVAYDATENPEAVGKEPSQAAAGPASALLNPSLALPTIYDDVFWPASSWPVGYDEVLQAAFAKAAGDRDRRRCQADRGSTAVKHIAGVIRPDETQRPLLQKLGGALAVASGFVGEILRERDPPAASCAPAARGDAARSADRGTRYSPPAPAGSRAILRSRPAGTSRGCARSAERREPGRGGEYGSGL